MGEGFAYLSLITDAYSKRILGYCLYPTLESAGCIEALKMALATLSTGKKPIHHSDRGVQYCCNDYTSLLQRNGLLISMTQKGDPYENAIAERVNGILKAEFDLSAVFPDFETAQRKVDDSITPYNQLRPHASCGYLTPDQAHVCTEPLNRKWKNYKKYQKEQKASVGRGPVDSLTGCSTTASTHKNQIEQ